MSADPPTLGHAGHGHTAPWPAPANRPAAGARDGSRQRDTGHERQTARDQRGCRAASCLSTGQVSARSRVVVGRCRRPRQDSNLRTHLRRTVERVVMAIIARMTSNHWPIDPRVPCDRHTFIPRTIPRSCRRHLAEWRHEQMPPTLGHSGEGDDPERCASSCQML
jgi:hypothetical protein